MKFICNFLLTLNFLAYVLADIVAWEYGMKAGLWFLLPLLLFPAVISLANKVAISRADKFFLSEWKVFVKKIEWGNGAVLLIMAIIYKLFLEQGN
ncbi:hypothetical protein [Phocaeicola faecium]|uniref:Uncharacterized protein n=1 Tax=Phocaeicola faecium TaxID=2762213 RepID=A0ABR8VAR5_9BACT|nr:hypothetical protein [Phocaeicola faecium]MBD8001870.1 hypothetical protein [Phocaeicola faecium]